jgi:hypothetical protein
MIIMDETYYSTLGIVAGILGLAGYIPYIISVVLGKTRPERATWFIWTLVGGLLAFSYLYAGDHNTIWLPLGYFVGPFIVAILSIWYGYSTWSKLDTLCVTAALISVIPWFLSSNAIFTLLLNVGIDAMGAIPTVIKTYHEPETEDCTAWVIFLAANTLQVVAIQEWNFAATYPIYLFVLALFMVAFILKGKFKKTV